LTRTLGNSINLPLFLLILLLLWSNSNACQNLFHKTKRFNHLPQVTKGCSKLMHKRDTLSNENTNNNNSLQVKNTNNNNKKPKHNANNYHSTHPHPSSSSSSSLYIWSAHYARSARGWGLFDHQKETIVWACLSVVWGCFCWPFSLFVTFCYFFYCL